MRKKIFSTVAVGAITASLAVISGIVTIGFAHYTMKEAERKVIKKASETEPTEWDADSEDNKTGDE